MKKILILLVTIFLSFYGFAQDTTAERMIYEIVEQLPDNSEVSVGIIKNGKVDFHGLSNHQDSLIQEDNKDKVFEIGSLTKVFTASILSLEIEDGKIALTDTINSYYPFQFKDNIKLTFKNLATHTSGLPRLPSNLNISNISNPYKGYDQEKLYNYLKELITIDSSKIDKTVNYSNLGYGLLGYTLGLVEDTSFQDLLEEKNLKRFGMKNSYTNTENVSNLAKSWDSNNKVVSNWDFDALFAAGGILSTTEDLTKFILAQFDTNNDFLTLTRKPNYDVDQEMKIGLGWLLFQGKNGNNFYWHNGGTGGYTSYAIFDPTDKNAVIILSNVSSLNPKMQLIDKLGYELMMQIAER